ncbi:hypothetical protein [Lachnoclostridium sp. MSJ-17]|uniref:hypothetical protein n=2 Tax=Clostridia TaxID=186801 RepID=UPI0020A17FB5|nr:hypothetical protein [Lachnoclostridium sp. MSJ-17]
MKNLFNLKTKTVNNNTTNTTTTEGVKTMKKTRKIKTKIIAGILSAVTVFSVGTMAIGSASAAVPPAMMGTVLKYVEGKTFGYAKDSVMKLAGPELAKMDLGPILNMVLGIEEEGTSNDDIIDKIDKSTAEIKAEINKVMDEVKELSTQTATYHTQQMNQLKAINSNIDTKDFRVQADTVAADFAHAFKRIDENKENITCNGKINNTTYKAYKEILADPKCNVSSMQANFDEMLRYLKGQRTSNNNENGYRQLTNYLMDRVVAADLGEHSFTKTPDYYGAVDSINAEIRIMEEQVLMDYAIINALNAMQFRVKEYEIDNGIITVNEDESPYARFENTAANLHSSMVDIDNIFKTVLKENGSIPSKYVVADLYVLDGNQSIKKGCTSFIDAWSQGIDSGKNFNVVVLKKGQYLTADAKKGFKFDENVKGLNDKGGFEIPEGRKVYINMYCKSNGFDCSAKKDLDLFTLRNGASLELQSAKLCGDNRKFVIPDNANNTTLKTKYVEFNGASYYGTDANPCIEISKKANNTNINLNWTEFNSEYSSRIKNDGKNTKINEWYVTRSWEKEERGGEYWGT